MAPALPHSECVPSFSAALLITSIYFPAGVKPDEMPENHSPFNLPNWCSLTSLSVLTGNSDKEKVAAQNNKCPFLENVQSQPEELQVGFKYMDCSETTDLLTTRAPFTFLFRATILL